MMSGKYDSTKHMTEHMATEETVTGEEGPLKWCLGRCTTMHMAAEEAVTGKEGPLKCGRCTKRKVKEAPAGSEGLMVGRAAAAFPPFLEQDKAAAAAAAFDPFLDQKAAAIDKKCADASAGGNGKIRLSDSAVPNFETYVMLLEALVEKRVFGPALEVCKVCLENKWAPPYQAVKGLIEGLVKSRKVKHAKELGMATRKAAKGDAKEKVEGCCI